uniref:Uncharacterized protein n=1 Tax=Mustela putorius furo TaxID=9669 RepID=M3YFN1_MUSPF
MPPQQEPPHTGQDSEGRAQPRAGALCSGSWVSSGGLPSGSSSCCPENPPESPPRLDSCPFKGGQQSQTGQGTRTRSSCREPSSMCPGENMALGLPQAGHRADWSTRPPHPAEGALRTGPGTGDLQGRGSSGCQSPCLGAGAGLGEAPAHKESPRLHYKARVLHVPGADPQRPGRPPCKCPPGGFTGNRRWRRTEAPPPAPETG